MPSTGDIQNDLRKLQTELRYIKYHDVDFKSLQTGNSSEFLKIYRYIFIDYNILFTKNLLNKYHCDFSGKNDQNFIDTMYKILRDYLNYKPSITKEQFFSTNFIEKKLQMSFEIITRIRQECNRYFTSTSRTLNIVKEKRTISTKVFTQLYDMNLETIDQPGEYPLSIEKNPIESKIHQLEEQIGILKGKIDDISERLDRVISVIQKTYSDNNSITSTDLINFNSRLTLIENELALLSQTNNYEIELKTKQSLIPQGILIESVDENPINTFTTLEHICSL